MAEPLPVTIRPAAPHEVGLVRDLVRAAYARWVPVIGREPRPMQADYDKAFEVHRFDLAEAGGSVVGLIETEARADHLWIENIAVAPEVQGRGVGRRLLAHADALALAAGLGELRLLTNGKMTGNIALYRSVGYGVDREDPFLDGTVVYMSKRLD